MDELVIAPRFNGPAGSANGGYTSGLVAALVGEGDAEVTLRLPPPLGRPLSVERQDGRVVVRDGDARVAEAEPIELRLDVPDPPSFQEAEQAAGRYPGFEQHAFPTCFVCGPKREPGDGLRIFAGPLRDGLFASPWVPDPSLAVDGPLPTEFVWAALDCPGAFAVGFSARGETVLGRLAARIDEIPEVGEHCVVTACRSARRAASFSRGRRSTARMDGSSVERALPGSFRYRCRRIAFLSSRAISSACAISSSMASCSAWM